MSSEEIDQLLAKLENKKFREIDKLLRELSGEPLHELLSVLVADAYENPAIDQDALLNMLKPYHKLITWIGWDTPTKKGPVA